ncbi:MAG: hypothetical protein QOE23_1961 [Pseudonocardiales bacterium]|jgi:streptogrisin D|nr:hypothetical protein [Pseudonocardiales bacterium]
MRPARNSIRTGVVALATGAVAAGVLLTAPAGQAAPPAQAAASATVALSAAGPQGGDWVYTASGTRCVLGFNVRDSNNIYYFLVSTRCPTSTGVWYANSARTTVLGNTVSSAAGDVALVKYADQTVSRSGTVDLYNTTSQDILTAASAYVGEPVKRSGSVGVHSGTVLALNVTVNYAEGSITGLIKTNICAEAGDAGAPLFDGTKAIGLLATSSGNCTVGGYSYYRPVTQPLSVYAVSVY